MPTLFGYDGTPLQLPNPKSQWSNTGGNFTGNLGAVTYFPLPPAMSSAFETTGYYTIPAKVANRPDLIAKELYGSEDYWWIPLWASSILDPFQLTVGTQIRVVSLTAVLAALR